VHSVLGVIRYTTAHKQPMAPTVQDFHILLWVTTAQYSIFNNDSTVCSVNSTGTGLFRENIRLHSHLPDEASSLQIS